MKQSPGQLQGSLFAWAALLIGDCFVLYKKWRLRILPKKGYKKARIKAYPGFINL